MNRKAHYLLSEIEKVAHQLQFWQGYLEWLRSEFKKEVESDKKVNE